ncbi:radical SAM protein, partial [Candidatus Sumerlaeota bacterium]|nr:radical SAM protein [Candidatus Sumerlaeota bacterium]
MANPLYLSSRVPFRKLMRRKMNSLARRLSTSRAPAYPIYAWITPTTRCNLRCITCVRSVEPEWKSMDLEPEVYEVVRKEILPGLMFVELSGTGEPLLAPIFYTILEDVLRLKIEFSITTNLTILPDAKTLGKIIRACGEIKVSIDGTDRETMTEIRRGLDYELFWRNLLHLTEMVKKINNPYFRLTFNFVITRRNVAQMPELVEMAHKLGIKNIVFSSFLVGNRTDKFVAES